MAIATYHSYIILFHCCCWSPSSYFIFLLQVTQTDLYQSGPQGKTSLLWNSSQHLTVSDTWANIGEYWRKPLMLILILNTIFQVLGPCWMIARNRVVKYIAIGCFFLVSVVLIFTSTQKISNFQLEFILWTLD